MRIIISLILLLSCGSVMSQNTRFDICPLKVGTEIPAGILFDKNDKAYELNDLVTDKPTVIIFYRGAWCGYCTAHLAELNDIKKEVELIGYQMFGITVDKPSKLEESTAKSESEISVYSDAKAELISAFGLDWTVNEELFAKYKTAYQLDLEEWSGEDHHSLPVPAVFIIKDGIIQFQYVNPNHGIRMKAETLLAILKTI